MWTDASSIHRTHAFPVKDPTPKSSWPSKSSAGCLGSWALEPVVFCQWRLYWYPGSLKYLLLETVSLSTICRSFSWLCFHSSVPLSRFSLNILELSFTKSWLQADLGLVQSKLWFAIDIIYPLLSTVGPYLILLFLFCEWHDDGDDDNQKRIHWVLRYQVLN